jgi:adenylyltransferase/sulfurtransferase
MDPLFIDDDDHYSRLRLIGWWRQERLLGAKILVVGAGAIGNEVLKNLALIGVGQIYLVDFDEIERSNLTRSVLFRRKDCGRPKALVAAEAVEELNPDTRVTAWRANVITDIGLGLFRDVNVVIGCLDNREARLWVNRQCWKVGTPWIDGGIQEINGVVKTFLPPEGACYECAMTENDYRLINLRYSCPLLKHDDLLAGKVPTAPTIASIVGGWQVQEALKILHGLPVEKGVAHVYNGVSNQTYTTKYQFKEDCLSHETCPEPISANLSAETSTAADLFDVARQHLPGEGELELALDRDLVTKLICGSCHNERPVLKARQAMNLSEAACPTCEQTSHPIMVSTIGEDSPLARQSLRALGVPPSDIVRVTRGSEEVAVLLADDTEQVIGRLTPPARV